MKISKPPITKLRLLLLVALAAAVGTLGVMVIATPSYWAHGAWRGYYDQPGEPSPVLYEDNRVWLLDEEGQPAFDITESDLIQSQLRPTGSKHAEFAMREPEYESGPPAEIFYPDNEVLRAMDRTILISIEDDVRAIPVGLLPVLVINDVIDGIPVLIVVNKRVDLYCVFEREYDGRVHTFGGSGHVYYENSVWDGNFGTLLWDLETKSLWWPQKGVAVSGPMRGTPMKMLDRDLWNQVTWDDIVEKYDTINVFRDGAYGIVYETEWEDFETSPDLVGQKLPKVTRWGDNSAPLN